MTWSRVPCALRKVLAVSHFIHCVLLMLSSVNGRVGCSHVLAIVNHPAMNTGDILLSILKWNGWIIWYFCAWYFFEDPPYSFTAATPLCEPVKSCASLKP